MTTTTHTPTPWKATPNHQGAGWNVTAGTMRIALCQQQDHALQIATDHGRVAYLQSDIDQHHAEKIALAARIAELEAALMDVGDQCLAGGVEWQEPTAGILAIARAALGAKP